MPVRAIFGPPKGDPVRGGLHVTVHLVPVFQERLVAFDLDQGPIRGRWLPWAVIEFGQNPYEAASILADDWLDTPLNDLSLADVLSLTVEGGGWELAIVYRAEVMELPMGRPGRQPAPYAVGAFDAIGAFEPVDLERWVGLRPQLADVAPAAQRELLF
ncbi:MAG: hypothetical protein ACKVVT_04010 [Dehalococcoidia bacterium]